MVDAAFLYNVCVPRNGSGDQAQNLAVELHAACRSARPQICTRHAFRRHANRGAMAGIHSGHSSLAVRMLFCPAFSSIVYRAYSYLFSFSFLFAQSTHPRKHALRVSWGGIALFDLAAVPAGDEVQSTVLAVRFGCQYHSVHNISNDII